MEFAQTYIILQFQTGGFDKFNKFRGLVHLAVSVGQGCKVEGRGFQGKLGVVKFLSVRIGLNNDQFRLGIHGINGRFENF